jgi:hypothetical protein
MATPGIQHHRADAGQPVRGPSTEPAVHRGPGTVGHYIQQPTALQVDQAGHPSGGRDPGHLEEARLVQAQRGHPLRPGRILHQLAAVVTHRPHHRRPADRQVAGHRRDRVGVLADPGGRLRPGPARSAPPRGGSRPCARSRSVPHRPVPDSARCACATRAPPGGHRWAGRVAGSCAGRGARPAPHSPDSRPRRPWSGPRPATHRPRPARRDLEAVQAEQPGGRGTTALTHLGLLADVTHPQDMRGPRCR